MGFPITGMLKKRTTVAATLLAAVAFALFSFPGPVSRSPVGAASCADQPLQPVGAAGLGACGVSRLSANPTLAPELHYLTGVNNARAATEAGQPRANAHLGRAGRATTSGAGGGGAAAPLPPRKTIDVSQLPPGLVAPAR
ncbi:MAG: hypothetical protein C0506_04690 [Anaerolinea sp.]|nr:hypothetical protein [Anaerolinea sp.]